MILSGLHLFFPIFGTFVKERITLLCIRLAQKCEIAIVSEQNMYCVCANSTTPSKPSQFWYMLLAFPVLCCYILLIAQKIASSCNHEV